jgi:hypothetical protein
MESTHLSLTFKFFNPDFVYMNFSDKSTYILLFQGRYSGVAPPGAGELAVWRSSKL